MFKKPVVETDAERGARAICGAYLLIAFSDGDYAPLEEGRLSSELAADDVFKSLDKAQLDDAMQGLGEAFRQDFDGTAGAVLDAIRSVWDKPAEKKAVMHAARVAVVADQSITAQEELALERIADALGLEKGAL